MENAKLFAFYNFKLLESSNIPQLLSEISVYEVIRIVGGIPLFYEDHLIRLQNSIKMANIGTYELSNEMFLNQTNELCNANNIYFGNIELRVSKSIDGKIHSYLNFIPHLYPSPVNYIEGVETALLWAERSFPNAKIKDTNTRLKANKYIEDNNLFEVLLVNNEGYITEGSKSNVFFVRGNSVFYAPAEFILPGITRKYVLKALDKLNITLVERLLHTDELKSIDGAFLCGTSPGILPIKNIQKIKLDVNNEIMRSAMFEFNKLVQAYFLNKS